MQSTVTISTLPGASHPLVVEETSGFFTSARAQKIGYSALSAIAMSGATFAAALGFATGALPMALIALPLAGISAGLARTAYLLIDYDDPATLARLRSEVWGQPLPEIVAKHGWDKLFGYGLIDAELFGYSFVAQAETLSFADLLRYYHEAASALAQAPRKNRFAAMEEYAVPSPALWKGKFERETEGLRTDAIYMAYPGDDLVAFGLLSGSQKEALIETGKAIRKRDMQDAALEQQFLDRTPLERAALARAIDLAEWTYRSHSAHAQLQQANADELFAISNLESCIRARIQSEKRTLQSFRDALLSRDCCPSPEIERRIQCREAETEQAIEALRHEKRVGIAQIQLNAVLRRAPIEQMLYCAEEARNSSIALAKEEFHIRTLPIRTEIDGLKEENCQQYKEKIDRLSKDYHS